MSRLVKVSNWVKANRWQLFNVISELVVLAGWVVSIRNIEDKWIVLGFACTLALGRRHKYG